MNPYACGPGGLDDGATPCGIGFAPGPADQDPCSSGDPCGGNSFLGTAPSAGCPTDGGGAPPPPPLPLECDATLYYRTVDLKVNRATIRFTHAFWDVTEIDPNNSPVYVVLDDIISAGPDKNNNGMLGIFVHGPNDPGAADTVYSGKVAWDSGESSSNCSGIAAMLTYATTWPKGSIPYGGIFGPNSNSVAGLLGQIGGFNPPAPPRSLGWNYWLNP
jgi:hypothetical protein